jgi:hypothetical protein
MGPDTSRLSGELVPTEADWLGPRAGPTKTAEALLGRVRRGPETQAEATSRPAGKGKKRGG